MVPIRQDLANKANYGGRKSGPNRYIVVHYTANDGDSDESNARYFKDNVVKASANYFVDDDSITCTVPPEYIAYHCGTSGTYFHPYCRNYNSIGVELCDAHRDGIVMATEKTQANAAELIAMLMKKYGIPITNVIRHYDVTHKLCPAYWVKDPAGFEQFKKRILEADEMIEQSYILVDGKRKPVRRILKDGQNFINLRDLVTALAGPVNIDVGSQGSIPVLTID